MQNLPSSTPPAPSNAGTPKNPPSHPLFRSMSFNGSGNSAPRVPPPVRATQPAYASNINTNNGRGDKNFMFATSMRPRENTQPGTPNRTMRTMNIPETTAPTAAYMHNAMATPQTNNYSLRLERRPASEKQAKAAQAKAQAQADAAKLRAKVKAEADVKARAAARTTARAAAKTAALHRAQRAQEEAAIARSRIPTWERSKFDADQTADPSDKPYGV